MKLNEFNSNDYKYAEIKRDKKYQASRLVKTLDKIIKGSSN